MSQITVPRSVVEGRSGPFPLGTYIGVMQETKQRWFKNNDTGKETTLFLDVTIGNNAPLDKGQQVGARTFRPSLTLVTTDQGGKKHALVDLTEFDGDNVPFALQQSAGVASQLAMAFGAASVDAAGNVSYDLGEFVEGLAANLYKGRSIVFEIVKHRPWTSKKTGKSGVEAIARYMSAEPTNVDTPEDAEFNGEETAAGRLRTRA